MEIRQPLKDNNISDMGILLEPLLLKQSESGVCMDK